jgi:hypothetical protein
MDFLSRHLEDHPELAPQEHELKGLRPGAARSYGHAQMLARLLARADRADPRFTPSRERRFDERRPSEED